MPAREITLPSAAPTGNAREDTIWVRYFPARADAAAAPGVVIIPPIGSDERDPLMERLAAYLTRQGIACAVMCLSYHGYRRPGGVTEAAKFAGGSVADVVQAFHQSASDVSTVAAWLRGQPDVDARNVGVVGISLGAVVAHLAMGQDSRLGVGVAILGGGDLPDLYRTSLLAKVQEILHPRHFTLHELAALKPVDPLTYAGNNRPRHVLMIEAARDFLIPPRDATELWHALGEPPIQWLDTGHFALVLAPESAFRTTAAYLQNQWSGRPDVPIPHVWAPTIKLGLIAGLGSYISPALQWQFLSLATSQHRAILQADFGLTIRGPFLGLAATVTPFVDIGVSPRLRGRGLQPYTSLHVVF